MKSPKELEEICEAYHKNKIDKTREKILSICESSITEWGHLVEEAANKGKDFVKIPTEFQLSIPQHNHFPRPDEFTIVESFLSKYGWESHNISYTGIAKDSINDEYTHFTITLMWN